MSHDDQVPTYPAPAAAPAPAAPVYPAAGMPVAPQYAPQHEQYGQYGAPPAPVERPRSLTTAVRLMYVGAALSVVGITTTWLQQGTLRDQITRSGTALDASQLDTAVTVALVFATVLGVIGLGLWLWMAAMNARGRSWARIVATVFGGLNLLSTLGTAGRGDTTPLALTASLVSLVLAVVILVLLWRPSSSEYYRAQSALRAARR